jgi:glycosyltransferase involved in cell wall biosynthesis
MEPRDRIITVLYLSLYTEFGGGEYGLFYLLKSLDLKRFNPILMTNKRGPLVEKVEALGIETVTVPFEVVMLQQLLIPRIFLKNMKASFTIKRFLADRKVDIIQCGDVLSLLLLFPALLTSRIPVVYSVIFLYEKIRAVLFNLLALFWVKHIVVLSKFVGDDLTRKTFGLKKKIKLIYWGIDLSKFHRRTKEEKHLLREKLGLPRDKKIVGFIGRYEVWKGHETFLNAASKLLQTRNDLFFLIVGGAMTEEIIPGVARYRKKILKRIEDLKLQDRLTVWGHRDDIPDVMASLDVFVCPSDQEPFGLVVLEALASGVPVVVSSTVGALEVLDGIENVFVAEPRNAVSFSDKITDALELDKKIFSSQQSQRLLDVLNQLSWGAYSSKYEQIYQHLIS